MLKRLLFILTVCIWISDTSFCQNTKNANVNEIDLLFTRLKDTDSLELIAPQGKLKAGIKVQFNDRKQPCTIILSGEINFRQIETLKYLVKNIRQQKLREGYIKSSNGLFVKGNFYTKIKEPVYVDFGVLKMRSFSIEDGDIKRQSSKNSKRD